MSKKRGILVTHLTCAKRLEGVPRVNAVKGIWQDDHTFLIDRLVLGLGQGPERWILTFDGEKLNVHVNMPQIIWKVSLQNSGLSLSVH
jgi:hypothetical protein